MLSLELPHGWIPLQFLEQPWPDSVCWIFITVALESGCGIYIKTMEGNFTDKMVRLWSEFLNVMDTQTCVRAKFSWLCATFLYFYVKTRKFVFETHFLYVWLLFTLMRGTLSDLKQYISKQTFRPICCVVP